MDSTLSSTQVGSRLTPSLGVKYNGKSSDILGQTEEFAPGSYVELRTCEVPSGWTNHPGYLGANILHRRV
jgi:hypothetical protein